MYECHINKALFGCVLLLWEHPNSVNNLQKVVHTDLRGVPMEPGRVWEDLPDFYHLRLLAVRQFLCRTGLLPFSFFLFFFLCVVSPPQLDTCTPLKQIQVNRPQLKTTTASLLQHSTRQHVLEMRLLSRSKRTLKTVSLKLKWNYSWRLWTPAWNVIPVFAQFSVEYSSRQKNEETNVVIPHLFLAQTSLNSTENFEGRYIQCFAFFRLF